MDETKKIFELMPLGLVILDRVRGADSLDVSSGDSYLVQSVNPAFSKMFGLPADLVCGQDLTSALKGRIGEDSKKILIHALVEGKDRPPTLGHFYHRDGTEFFARISTCYETKNRLLLFFQEEVETNSVDLQKLKLEALGKLSGGIAHDFNNILSIIEGYGLMLKRRISPESDMKKDLEHILKAAKRGASLTRQLLAFSRQKITFDMVEEVNLVVREQASLLKPLLGETIEVLYDVPDCPVYIDSSPDVLAQILMNLAINARDAMPNGGKLQIAVRSDSWDKPNVCIEVRDSGQGIDPANIDHIFDPFFTTKDQGKGTGLGLSTVRGLVEQMGGQISVETELGMGTCFQIILPKSKEVSEPVTLNKEDIVANRFELVGRSILIAEDEPEIRSLLKGAFERLGMKTLTAENGNEALLVQDEYEGCIDFLLTDVVMPGMDGGKLVEMIKSFRPNIRTIFMSGYPGREDYKEIKLPDDAQVIAKPLEMDRLIYLLQRMASGANDEEITKIYQMLSTA